MRRTLLMVALLAAGSCGRSAPTGPAPTSQPQAVRLSGSVSETAPTSSTAIADATVTIIDGPYAGQSATTDGRGVFQFSTMQPGEFTIRISAAGYVERLQPITLAVDQTVKVELDPVFRIVTTADEESLHGSEAGCGAWDYLHVSGLGSCMVQYGFSVHYAGPVTVALTWPERDTAPLVELYRASNGVPTGAAISITEGTRVEAHTEYIIQVRKYAVSGETPPVGTTTFMLTVTRPN